MDNKLYSEKMYSRGSFEIESGLDIFRPDIFSFLSMYAPGKLRMLKSILAKLGFSFSGAFIADLAMPNYIGGYFAPSENILAINPFLLLYGSEKEIAHVLFHEGLHAGIFTEAPVMDEALTEKMTKQKMKELYGGSGFKSGYDGLVQQATDLLGQLSFSEMSELIEDGDRATFNNLLEVSVVAPSVEEGVSNLSWESLKDSLQSNWDLLKKLFPRMMNKIAGNNRGLHESTNLDLYHFELDGILQKAAFKIFNENQNVIVQLLMKVTLDGTENLNLEIIRKKIFEEGFGYLFDFEPDVMPRMIKSFIGQAVTQTISGNSLQADKIDLLC